MTAYLSSLLASMNGADLVACGILALLALGIALWSLVTWTPIAWQRAQSSLARWHSRQIRRANVPQEFPPDPVPFPWAALLVTLAVVGLAAFVLFRCGWAR